MHDIKQQIIIAQMPACLKPLAFVCGKIAIECLNASCETSEEQVLLEELVNVWQGIHIQITSQHGPSSMPRNTMEAEQTVKCILRVILTSTESAETYIAAVMQACE